MPAARGMPDETSVVTIPPPRSDRTRSRVLIQRVAEALGLLARLAQLAGEGAELLARAADLLARLLHVDLLEVEAVEAREAVARAARLRAQDHTAGDAGDARGRGAAGDQR